MFGLSAVRTAAGALAVVVSAGLVCVATAPAASATSASAETGSILYDKNGDIYQTTPDRSVTHRVTTNGSTASSDKTGNSGYAVPTESDDGLIVAVRNQSYSGYSKGFLWVMDRDGHVLAKFAPPQFKLLAQFPGCSGPDAQLPQGILNATVSPDGKHVAYTATAVANDASCQAMSEVGSWIVDIDGTNGHWLSADPFQAADLEIGRWVSNTRLLIDRWDFGYVQNFRVDLPSYAATAWAAPASGDMIDQAYLQPDVANGVLVTDGYSSTSSNPVIRIWAANNFSTAPGPGFCEFTSVANPGTTDVNLNQPSLSPDGAYVIYEDYNGTAPDASNEGLYLAPAASVLGASQACTDASASLFVPGAEDPFWTPASITQLPPDTTAPSVDLKAPARTTTLGSSVGVSWAGSDAGSGIAYYQLRQRVAPYSAGFSAWSTPQSGQHLTTTAVTATGLSRGSDYCFEVRAADRAGNVSPWSAARCTAIPLDDRSMSRSAGWKSGSGSGYYASTVTTTSRTGAALTRSGAKVTRVAVLATTCPTCGTVSVTLGSHSLGTINLHSSRTVQQVLKTLPTFALLSGTVKLTVTSTGKSVAIDGVLLSRT